MQGQTRLELDDGSRVGVVGGGPAGSFFSYFLLDMAERVGIDIRLDIYEPKDFSRLGPAGCNHCGGVVHESLVQILATEGINLPPTVVQRGIDSHVLHMGVGSVRIETPVHEKRIGAMYRGGGPRGSTASKWGSLDGYLLSLATDKGASLIPERVTDVSLQEGRPQVRTRDGLPQTYDLLIVATGVNTAVLKAWEACGIGYRRPRTARTYVREYHLGEELVETKLGSSVHVFLLNIRGIEFAALIPKGDYVTLCLVGEKMDKDLLGAFLVRPEVRQRFPPGFALDQPSCHCAPRMNIRGAVQPYADRIAFVGDCGVTRFYKDGIGSAYRAAKAAAVTAMFHGVSAKDFGRTYGPVCRALHVDNAIAKLIFALVGQLQRRRFARRAMARMVLQEQGQEASQRRLSTMMWDMYTGSAPYRETLLRSLHPAFLSRFVGHCIVSMLRTQQSFVP
jgi:flavin-dependent dehydrogenase